MIINMSLPGLAKEAKAELAYTGAWTQTQITSNGVTYDLYTLTGSGTLTVTGTAKNVDVWACGGGASETATKYTNRMNGWAGAYCAQTNSQTLSGNYIVTVGGATGSSSFGSFLIASGTNEHNGGTGGGVAGNTTAVPTGDGITKYPFGDSTNFECHCAGGGGQADTVIDSDLYGYGKHFAGGSGGTNGGNGIKSTRGAAGNTYSDMVTLGSSYCVGGDGGRKGGGIGCTYGGWNTDWTNRTSATFYGSGAGGGRRGMSPVSAPGSGYQGVVYIRIPA